MVSGKIIRLREALAPLLGKSEMALFDTIAGEPEASPPGDAVLAVLVSLRDRCSAQRADWLKEARGAPRMIQASCAMAAGSFGTVLEWIEEAIAAHKAGGS